MLQVVGLPLFPCVYYCVSVYSMRCRHVASLIGEEAQWIGGRARRFSAVACKQDRDERGGELVRYTWVSPVVGLELAASEIVPLSSVSLANKLMSSLMKVPLQLRMRTM